MGDFRLLPTDIITDAMRAQLIELGEYMFRDDVLRRLALPPKLIQRRSGPNALEFGPNRYDLSIDSVTARYALAGTSQQRHHRWVEEAVPELQQLCNDLNALAQKLTDAIVELNSGQVMNVMFSILLVEDGAASQKMHVDNNDADVGDYWSAIIPLTDHPDQGGTEFQNGGTPLLGRGYYFGGNVPHRGTRNSSGHTRYALMTVITRIVDENRSLSETPIVIRKRRQRKPNPWNTGGNWAPR